jgi:hypothetical protein
MPVVDQERLRLILVDIERSKTAIALARHNDPEVNKALLMVAVTLHAIKDYRDAHEYEDADELLRALTDAFWPLLEH